MQIIGIADAARCLPLNLWEAPDRFSVQVTIRSGERAVTRNVRAEHMRGADLQISLHRFPQDELTGFLPSVRGEHRFAGVIDTNIEGKDHLLRIDLCHPAHDLIRSSDGSAADDCTFHAAIEKIFHAIQSSQTPTDLQTSQAFGREFDNDFAVWLLTVACSIQVDDVNAACSE